MIDQPGFSTHFGAPVETAVVIQHHVGPIDVGGRRAAAREPVRLLPSWPAERLFGRAKTIERVVEQLTCEPSPCLVFTGPPGVGKSALARQVVEMPAVRAKYKAILWAGIGPDSNPDAEVARLATLLGVDAPAGHRTGAPDVATTAPAPANPAAARHPSDGPTSLRQRLARDVSHRQPVLVVIDGARRAEHVEGLMLPDCPVSYIITTRELGLTRFATRGGEVRVKEISTASSRQLLTAYAPEAVRAEPRLTRAIIEAAQGLPLALILVGQQMRPRSRVATRASLAKLLARLLEEIRLAASDDTAAADDDDDDGGRGGHGADGSAAAAALIASINLTVDELDGPTREALWRLSLLPPKPATFSEDAFKRTACCDDEVLEALVSRSLVERATAGRYCVQRVIRAYAERRRRTTLAADAAARAVAGLVDHYCELLAHAAGSARLLQAEHENLLAALDAAVSHGLPQLFPFLERLHPTLARSGMYCSTWFRSLLAAAQATAERRAETDGPQQQARLDDLIVVLLIRAEAFEKVGDYGEAGGIARRLSELAERVPGSRHRVRVLHLLSVLKYDGGDYLGAELDLRQAILAVKSMPEPEQARHGQIFRRMGEIQLNVGNLDAASEYFEGGLGLARSNGDAEAVSGIYLGLGVVAFIRQDFPAARERLGLALQWARKDAHAERMAAVLHMLGATTHCMAMLADAPGERGALLEESGRALAGALRWARSIRHAWYVCAICNECGELHRKRARAGAANLALRRALVLAETIKAPDRQAFVLYSHARLARDTQDFPAAAERARQSLSLFRGMRHYMVRTVTSFLCELPTATPHRPGGRRGGGHGHERLADVQRPKFKLPE